jgi:hypothetical protein
MQNITIKESSKEVDKSVDISNFDKLKELKTEDISYINSTYSSNMKEDENDLQNVEECNYISNIKSND